VPAASVRLFGSGRPRYGVAKRSSAPTARASAPMVFSVGLPLPLSMRLILLWRIPEAAARCCWERSDQVEPARQCGFVVAEPKLEQALSQVSAELRGAHGEPTLGEDVLESHHDGAASRRATLIVTLLCCEGC
jgi:hypothetical protein